MKPHINIETTKHGKRTLTGMMAMAALLGVACGMPGMPVRNPSQQERNDPRREKTPADMERMAAAQRKRGRKGRPNAKEHAPALAGASAETGGDA